jgi:cobalamin biosynthesis Mg chelatase CobN
MYPDQYANRNQNTQPYQNGPYAPGAVSPGTVGPGTIGYNQYDNSQQGNGFQSNPTGQDGGPFARTASNTSLNSAAPQQQNSNLAAQTATGTDTSASDSLARAGTEQGTKNDTSSSTNKSAETQGIVTVLFLLSLVFNIYLALLIRKLLGRYRNVLMNLRTQAA